MLNDKKIRKIRKLIKNTDEMSTLGFKALSEVNRYRIFRILVDKPKLTVTDISMILDISKPLASQHLKVLTQANLVQKDRSGKKIYSRLETQNPFVRAIIQVIILSYE